MDVTSGMKKASSLKIQVPLLIPLASGWADLAGTTDSDAKDESENSSGSEDEGSSDSSCECLFAEASDNSSDESEDRMLSISHCLTMETHSTMVVVEAMRGSMRVVVVRSIQWS